MVCGALRRQEMVGWEELEQKDKLKGVSTQNLRHNLRDFISYATGIPPT